MSRPPLFQPAPDPAALEEESPEVLAAQMASISEAFALEIEAALQVGDADRARRLVAEMREQMNALMHPERLKALRLVANSDPAALSVYDQSQCSIDLSLVAYDGDRDAFAELI